MLNPEESVNFPFRDLTVSEQKLAEAFREEIFCPKQQSKIVKYVGYAGFGNGAFASLIAYPYGYQFGARIASFMPSAIEKGTGHLFGFCSTAAMAALGGRIAKKVYSDFVKREPESAKELEKSGFSFEKFAKYLHLGLVTFLGGISAAPTIYLTHEFFSKYIGDVAIFQDVSVFLAQTTVRGWALNNLNMMVLHSFKDPFTGYVATKADQQLPWVMRHKLITMAQDAKRMLSHMSQEEIQHYHDGVFTGKPYTSEEIIENICRLLQPTHQTTRIERYIDSFKKYIGLIGLAIGSLSVYSLYYFGVQAGHSLCDLLGIDDEVTRMHLGHFVGAASYICVGALGMHATQDVMEKSTDSVLSLLSKLRSLILGEVEFTWDNFKSELAKQPKIILTTVLFVAGIISSSPRAELVIDALNADGHLATFYGPIFIGCAFLATGFVDFWSMDSQAKEMISGKSKISRLAGALSLLEQKFRVMKDEYIVALYNVNMDYFANQPGHRLNINASDLEQGDYRSLFFDTHATGQLSSHPPVLSTESTMTPMYSRHQIRIKSTSQPLLSNQDVQPVQLYTSDGYKVKSSLTNTAT